MRPEQVEPEAVAPAAVARKAAPSGTQVIRFRV